MKYNNYLFPSTVVIEPTNVCNLRCKMCQAKCTTEKGIKKVDMTPEKLKTVLSKLEGYIVNIVFQGDCECTLNPYLPELVRVASEYSEQVGLVTNGTLLTESLVTNLLKNGLNFFSISIDDHRPKNYSSIRVGADLSSVLANVKNLLDMCKKDYPDVNMLVHKIVFPEDTTEDVKEFIRIFTYDYPVSKITLAPLICYGHVVIKDWIIFRNNLENELIKENIFLNLRDYENYPYRAERKYYCGTNLFFVDYEGNLKACPLHSGSEKRFGNLLDETLENIAQKETFKEYHSFWLEKNYRDKVPSMCDDCYVIKNPYYFYCLDDGVNAINIFRK